VGEEALESPPGELRVVKGEPHGPAAGVAVREVVPDLSVLGPARTGPLVFRGVAERVSDGEAQEQAVDAIAGDCGKRRWGAELLEGVGGDREDLPAREFSDARDRVHRRVRF
jgi:hypothetical protein